MKLTMHHATVAPCVRALGALTDILHKAETHAASRKIDPAVLLGVKAVIAESFERIHRSNLIGMGVLPLQYKDGQSMQSLGLTGRERFEIVGLNQGAAKSVKVIATADDGKKTEFEARLRIDTPKELDYYQHGGILHYVLRQLAALPKAA